jgi:SAM-dependent methyltransferase
MDDNTIEIRDDKINVEEIMAKIRENIRRRQAAGKLPGDPDSVIESPSKYCPAGESDYTIQRDLSYINANWDIHNNSYFISSHQPYIGKFLVKGRQLVHGEVRRYIDPMISRQTEFNASTVRIINRTSQRCAELNQRQQDLETAFSSFKPESDKKIADCITTAKNELDSKIELSTKELTTAKSELDAKIELLSVELDSKIELTIKDLFSRMDEDIHAKMWLAHVLEDRIQKGLAQKSASPASTPKETTNYFLFEERFRGSREDIKQRQMAFLPYFEKCSRVLDIGCGRGEFLEILKDHNIGGIGVDSDPDMVAYCHSRQLEVKHADAIDYLETLSDNSLDGIFIDQVVEHLEPYYLVRLLALCHQKMKSGYHIVVETVNPLSFVSFVNFYIDMTHKQPVHPETLQYLLSASGFREYEKKFFSPVSDEGRLKKFEGTADMNTTERENNDVYNHNVEILNELLYGAQDYAIVGKK